MNRGGSRLPNWTISPWSIRSPQRCDKRKSDRSLETLNAERAMDPQKKAWFEAQVDEFERERLGYEKLTAFLPEVLGRLGDRYAPGSRVESRTKAVSSFAEKILRKYEHY